MDGDAEQLFQRARELAVTAESGETLAIVTALEGLATEISSLRNTLERHSHE